MVNEPVMKVIVRHVSCRRKPRLAADRETPSGSLPEPARLLAAHGEAMPAGVGAALGFDRLVMLAAGATPIDAVRCFFSADA
jgi:elongation factor P--beta-lysine ligase